MLHDAGKKLLPSRISGAGATKGMTLQYSGTRWAPAPASGLGVTDPATCTISGTITNNDLLQFTTMTGASLPTGYAVASSRYLSVPAAGIYAVSVEINPSDDVTAEKGNFFTAALRASTALSTMEAAQSVTLGTSTSPPGIATPSFVVNINTPNIGTAIHVRIRQGGVGSHDFTGTLLVQRLA